MVTKDAQETAERERKRLLRERRAELRALRRAGIEPPAALLVVPDRRESASGDAGPDSPPAPARLPRIPQVPVVLEPVVIDLVNLLQTAARPASWCQCPCGCSHRHVDGARCLRCLNGTCPGQQATVERLPALRAKYRGR